MTESSFVVPDAVQRVREITRGEMADVVLDVTAGTPEAVSLAIELAAIGATIVLAASHGGRPLSGFVSDEIVRRKLTIKGALGHGLDPMKRAVALIESRTHELDPMCTHTFPVSQADAALRTLGGEGDPDAIHITVVPD